AYIEKPAATPFGSGANVVKIALEIAERTYDGPELAEFTASYQFPDSDPLWMGANHKGLADLDTGLIARRDQRLTLSRAQADGFFAQHVFARPGGPNRPRNVQVVRQGIIDRLHIRIGEQFFVRPVSLRNLEFPGRGL